LIEAAIVEISTQEGEAVGVQLASADTSKNGKSTVPLMGTNLGAGNILSLNQIAAMIKTEEGALGPGITLGAGKTTEDGALRYGLLLQALQSSANSNLLSTPSILTLDNQEAEIVVGQNVPFRTGSTATGTDGTANPFTTIKREDIGVTLKVKPRINEGDVVRLEVEQTTESINKEVSIGSSGSADIVTNKRSIKTVITAGNGEIVVLGGLISDDIVISDSKVPLLGDIPFLGALFRSTSKENVKRNLMVFLRPSIVKEESNKQELANARYDLLRKLIKDDGKEKGSEEAPSIDRIFKGENQ
jgi:general secretion pathway protein D